MKKIKNLYNIAVGDSVVMIQMAEKGVVVQEMSDAGYFTVDFDKMGKLPVHATCLILEAKAQETQESVAADAAVNNLLNELGIN